MARKNYKYSLAKKDRKVAGVAATLGDKTGIDPTLWRIGWIAAFLFVSWEFALISYVAMGIFFSIQKKKDMERGAWREQSEFDRMGKMLEGRSKGSTHDMLNKLEDVDRRMMAIDHHLNSAENDELAREIEKLREKK